MLCKSCGGELVLTSEPYVDCGYIPIIDVERYECPKCHARVFTADQMGALLDCSNDYRVKRMERLCARSLPQPVERCFEVPKTDEAIDKMLDWASGGSGVARFGNEGSELCCMSVQTYCAIVDAGFPALPMELWELNGFCAEDMPTLQHVFQALDTEAFVQLVVSRDCVEDDDEEARDEVMGELLHLRTLEAVSCDDSPIVLLPRRIYLDGRKGEWACECVHLEGYRFSYDADKLLAERISLDGVSVEEILGWKAWLAMPGVRDTYEMLAELFARVRAGDAVAEEELPKADSPYTRELNEVADGDFRLHVESLLGCMVPAEELVTLSFEVDADVLEKAEVVVAAQGLTMQNALNIAVNRLIAWGERESSVD